MAITVNSPSFVEALPTDRVYWTACAYSADASGCEEIKAAPGAGKSLYLQHVIVGNLSTIVTIGEGETASAVTTKILEFVGSSIGFVYDVTFIRPIKLTTNTALTVDAATTDDITVIVEGFTAP